MKIDWKDAAMYTSGALAGTAVGMALVTLVGNLVDGDEVYTIQSRDKTKTAIIVSYRGGLFAHAHPLIEKKYTESDSFGDIKFTIGNSLGHSHATDADEYLVNSKQVDGKTLYYIDIGGNENVSLSGALHQHKLKVLTVL
jgi:hypothetical protein